MSASSLEQIIEDATNISQLVLDAIRILEDDCGAFDMIQARCFSIVKAVRDLEKEKL